MDDRVVAGCLCLARSAVASAVASTFDAIEQERHLCKRAANASTSSPRRLKKHIASLAKANTHLIRRNESKDDERLKLIEADVQVLISQELKRDLPTTVYTIHMLAATMIDTANIAFDIGWFRHAAAIYVWSRLVLHDALEYLDSELGQIDDTSGTVLDADYFDILVVSDYYASLAAARGQRYQDLLHNCISGKAYEGSSLQHLLGNRDRLVDLATFRLSCSAADKADHIFRAMGVYRTWVLQNMQRVTFNRER